MSLVPDLRLGSYTDLTSDILAGYGVRALLIDIDNTLAPYEQPLPDDRHREWFASLSAAGIRCALISNNKPDRVQLFNASLGLPAYADCGKPRRKYLRIALEELGVAPADAAVLGDQIFTDCLSARRMGMKAFIVPPIHDKRTLFFRFKRALEKPFIRAYDRRHGTAAHKQSK